MDGDGCDTRREVLIEESIEPVTETIGCSLQGGRWYSAFDGVETDDPSTFDVDHMVPLKEAWDSGAWAWDAARRQAFANDTTLADALIAVSASSNRSKGSKDPAEWMPPL
ncbi:MAG: HNH endonuclease family protein, partial [Acidimicrobiales bacterium]|nr:HNH endonuclease family protein [Acidimicrobiales bacterium]